MSEQTSYEIAGALITFIAGLIVYQTSRIKSLKNQILQDEYEKEKAEIEKNIHELSDDDLRNQLDDFTKKSGG